MARAYKSKAKGGPEHTIALPCVILAIDPGKTSGWALYLEGRPVHWGAVNAGDSERVQQVLLRACELAQLHRLPLVLLGETWNVGGSHASPAMWQGLGAAWGAWKLSAEHLSSSRRDQPGALGPQLVAGRILRVSTSTWRARFGMMRAPKDAPKDWYKTMALQVVERELGLTVAPDDHDAAEALLIGLWGTRAQAVGKKLPARVMKARGLVAGGCQQVTAVDAARRNHPATKGWLLAMLREASGSPFVTTIYTPGKGWLVVGHRDAQRVHHPSEGEALAAALRRVQTLERTRKAPRKAPPNFNKGGNW